MAVARRHDLPPDRDRSTDSELSSVRNGSAVTCRWLLLEKHARRETRTGARRPGFDRRDGVPARLPGRVQPGRDGSARQGASRSTDRTRIRSPAASSARRCGSSASASTDPIACSIRRVRKGRKGEGKFKRVTWDEALERIAERDARGKSEMGRRIDSAVSRTAARTAC